MVSKYQFVFTWDWGFGYKRPFGSLSTIYKWYLVIGYFQIRRWRTVK